MCTFYRMMTDVLIQDYLGALDEPEELDLRVRNLKKGASPDKEASAGEGGARW